VITTSRKGTGKDAVLVREVQRDLGDVDGAACRRPLKDHLVHLRAAHQARALLAQHPPDRVRDVGLAATVRTDDRRHARFEHELRGVGERLESVELELGETH
jgi:hypothetical protein